MFIRVTFPCYVTIQKTHKQIISKVKKETLFFHNTSGSIKLNEIIHNTITNLNLIIFVYYKLSRI
jgi:hypothetical protein